MSKKNKKNNSLQKQILHLRALIALRIMQCKSNLTLELVTEMVQQVADKEKQNLHHKIDQTKLLDFGLKIAFSKKEVAKMKKQFPNWASQSYKNAA